MALLVVCWLAPPSLFAARPAVAAAPSYDVAVSLDLDAGSYSGREVVRVINPSKGGLDEVFFNLYPNVGAATPDDRLLTVTAARVGDRAVAFRHEGSGLVVKLDEDISPHGSVDLTLEFEGRATELAPDRIGLGAHVTDQVSIVLSPAERRPLAGRESVVHSGDAMLLANPFPVLSLTKDERWRREVTAGDVVFSGIGAWRIAVTAQADVDVVASGAAEPAAAGEARVFHGDAMRSVAVFASRGMAVQAAEAAGMRLRSVATPAHEKASRQALETLGGAVGVYTDLFGEPPVDELTIVEAPLPPGSPSLAFSGVVAIASAYYTDLRGPDAKDLPGFIRETPELTEGELDFAVLHEAARQWWGEAVGTDPQRAAFLDEGLATYSAVLAIERLRGDEAAERAVEQRMRAPYRVFRMFGGADAAADRRAGEFPNYFAYAAIVAAKGGLYLQALRKTLGDERFLAGLRRFYETNRGRVASPQGLAAALAEGAPRPQRDAVSHLYDRWIEQRHGDEDIGAPEYAVAVDPKVASAVQADPKPGTGFERFGRLIVRKLVWFGKTAAKPF